MELYRPNIELYKFVLLAGFSVDLSIKDFVSCSYFWGWLADKHSKKSILMCSGICMAFCSLFFGFSVNFYMAIVFRYLTGLTNGKNISNVWEA